MTDKAMVDVGFAGINSTYKQKRSASWRVKSKLDARCRTNDRHSEYRPLYWLRD
ncbi:MULTISPECIES: hypothetical protein [unclassified Microcoleus]|uniref:hypothetical protein n=1 Tax=unclassified Microcoleus TaxID=2642155 RepID=UPI002FD5388B